MQGKFYLYDEWERKFYFSAYLRREKIFLNVIINLKNVNNIFMFEIDTDLKFRKMFKNPKEDNKYFKENLKFFSRIE